MAEAAIRPAIGFVAVETAVPRRIASGSAPRRALGASRMAGDLRSGVDVPHRRARNLLGGLMGRGQIARPFLLGAAIGSGLVARAAERGGADFILALNAGRLRTRGLPSVASMLPLGDANAEVAEFARREIAPQIELPVYAGLSVFDAPEELDRTLRLLAGGEVAGVVNFPTAVHYTGEVRRTLEAAGRGFAAEMEMLRRAASLGLATLAYVKTDREAEMAARVAPGMVCINFGWNAGGRLTELVPDVSINEAILRARTIARRLVRDAPQTAVLIEGGPVVHPLQVAEICAEAGTHGYVGGSTLDRLPIEDAVYDRALAFKSAARARRPGRRLDARLREMAGALGLVGPSEALESALDRVSGLAAQGGHVVISGQPGTQRHAAARLFLALAGLEERLTILDAEEQPAFETGVRLFGRGVARTGLLEEADGGALRIEPLGALEARWQRKLARFLDVGSVTRYRGRVAIAPRPTVLALSDRPLAALAQHRLLVPELAARLAPREVVMPSLAERREDLPALVEWLTAQGGGRFELGPSALGLLMRVELPRNVSDLRHLVEALTASGARGTLGAVDLDPLLALPRMSGGEPDGAAAERAWILDTLRRHAFNRTAAAREMGIARKTLYNRMKRHGL
jgi:predicted TIM-barrel enzyme